MTSPITISSGANRQTGSAAGLSDARLALLARLLTIALLILAFWLGAAPLTAVPAALPADAPAAGFSAARAITHLQTIAAAPRPIGSPQAVAVSEYLVEQLRSFGYDPQLQSATVFRGGGREGQALVVRNVLARLEGAGDGPALLLSGHYDSVATSPAAGDCGQCAAVVLEAARALRAGPMPPNDVIILLTDGEEVGVAGAQAFVEQHPWAEDVGLSVVVEGYGNGAASMMYITGEESGALQQAALRAMDGATRFPVAYSFIHQLMWVLAGNTGSDLDAFLRGATGLGLIYLSFDTTAAYHTAADDLARLDPRTVQHQGDVALGLARVLDAGAVASRPSAPDQIIFPLLPGVTTHYAGAAALPLATVAALLLLALLVAGARRAAWRGRGLLAGLALWPLAFLLSVLVTGLVWWLARFLTPGLRGMTVGGWYGAAWYLAAVLGVGAAVAMALYGLFRRRLEAADLYAAALVWWALLGLFTAWAMPGWSYLFVWPLLAAILVQVALWAFDRRLGVLSGGLLRAVPAIVGVWLFAAVLVVLWIYAGRMEAIMGIPAAWLPLLMGAWLFGLLLPAFEPLSGRAWGRAAGMTVLAAVLLLAAGALATQPAPAHPVTDSITYRADYDTGEAAWLALSDSRAGRGTRGQIDAWTAQFFPDDAEGATETTLDVFFNGELDAPFPALSMPAPLVQRPTSALILSGPSGRTHPFSLVQAAGSELTQVRFTTASPITSVSVNGQALEIEQGMDEWMLNIYGAAAEPIAVDLATTVAGPVQAQITDAFLGLPDDAGIIIQPRPPERMAAPLPDVTDRTLIAHTVTFQP